MVTTSLDDGVIPRALSERLHARLDEALAHLSVVQQLPCWDRPSTSDVEVRRELASIATEIVNALGQQHLLLDHLTSLISVPGEHNPAFHFKVRLQLEHNHQEGWALMRDDANGGGPWRRGPNSASPTQAVRNFMKMIEAGQWSASK
jgi:hypothetical protein